MTHGLQHSYDEGFTGWTQSKAKEKTGKSKLFALYSTHQISHFSKVTILLFFKCSVLIFRIATLVLVYLTLKELNSTRKANDNLIVA